MIRTSLWAAAATAILLTTACANPPGGSEPGATTAKVASPKRHCFFTNSVNSFTAVDEETVNVRVGVKDIYRLDLMGRCPDIDWNQSIALVSRGGSSICSGLDATIITKGPIGPQRCPVRMVTKLTPEEVAALKPKAKP